MLETVNPDAARYAELSADGFLAAGNRSEAARSIIRVIRCTLADAPREALRKLDDVLAWFVGDDPQTRDRRASLLHLRADALLRLGRPDLALETAKRAAEERAMLRGAEASRAGSFALASHAAEDAGRLEEAVALAASAKALREQCDDPRGLEDRLRLAIESADFAGVEAVRAAAASAGDAVIEARALILLGAQEAKTSAATALVKFEQALAKLRAANAPADDIVIAENAVGGTLLDAKEPRRALPYFERMLRLDPLHSVARQNYAAILWQLKEWTTAATYFEGELARHGERPVIL